MLIPPPPHLQYYLFVCISVWTPHAPKWEMRGEFPELVLSHDGSWASDSPESESGLALWQVPLPPWSSCQPFLNWKPYEVNQ